MKPLFIFCLFLVLFFAVLFDYSKDRFYKEGMTTEEETPEVGGTLSVGLSMGEILYGVHGGTITVIPTATGDKQLKLLKTPSSTPVVLSKKGGGANIYYGGGMKATATRQNGSDIVEVQSKDGKTVYHQKMPVKDEFSNTAFNSTQYYGSTGTVSVPAQAMQSTQPPPPPPTQPFDYASSLPQGIPRSDIPTGDEDLYILKSEIVPPVCPACPAPVIIDKNNGDNSSGGGGGSADKCPPCPACARCPANAFECKKVPNYNAISSKFLPVPVMADFSSFGA